TVRKRCSAVTGSPYCQRLIGAVAILHFLVSLLTSVVQLGCEVEERATLMYTIDKLGRLRYLSQRGVQVTSTGGRTVVPTTTTTAAS
ncbi:unnamed protein product, partial [Amoebophrya sp. A25]